MQLDIELPYGHGGRFYFTAFIENETLQTISGIKSDGVRHDGISLIKCFVVPLMPYGANVYYSLDYVPKNKLQATVNKCAKYVYTMRKYDFIAFL
uniref:Uncharacterized protein n=1 Tax=Glossina palpalis gambiensis TaxID=67801 RepID=A0A1B0BRL1_9MUSC